MSEEGQLQQRTSGTRLFQLDALRGIAAVTVVVHHLRYAYTIAVLPWYFVPFEAGREAVDLFFVLSGFVLSIPLWNKRQAPYPEYVLRRLCRIYIPFAAAVTLSIAGDMVFRGTHRPLSIWFYNTWQQPITLKLVVHQYLMYPIFEFNTALWSIGFEMQMSILMPVLCLFLLRVNAIAGTFLLMVFSYIVIGHFSFFDGYTGQSFQIAAMFALGATIARYRKPLGAALGARPRLLWLLLAIGLTLFYDVPLVLSGGRFFRHLVAPEHLLSGLGAAIIIIVSLFLAPFANVLRHPFLEYLGRISYSLYLVHSIVLFTLLDTLSGRLPVYLLVILIILLCWLAAHLFCVFVEEPAIKLGKRLHGRWPRPNGNPVVSAS